MYLGPFEFIFVAVVHLNEGTFFCRSGSPWHEVPTILKQENYFSEKKGAVPQIVGKNPEKYVRLKKKIPALKKLVSCTFRVTFFQHILILINIFYQVENMPKKGPFKHTLTQEMVWQLFFLMLYVHYYTTIWFFFCFSLTSKLLALNDFFLLFSSN